MCGILGIYGYGDIAADLIFGLTSLQHRGQDAAGLVTFNGENFHTKKGLGLVNNVFKERSVPFLKGYSGIGHVRYSTQGSTDLINAQPFSVNYPFGIAMAHNGNVTNFAELKKSLFEDYHRIVETSNDLELILYTLASELEQRDLKNLTVENIFDSISSLFKRVKGGYSVISIIANKGFLAFCDPFGIRPLSLGKTETQNGPVYAFASESTCFDSMGYQKIKDLSPGEAVFIDSDRKLHTKICNNNGSRAFCLFEYIYFAKEDSVIYDKLIASSRVRMGRLLARHFNELKIFPDIVIDVPSSSYFFASGLAEELNVPYRRGLSKNNHIGRSFICPSNAERETIVRQKLNPIKDIIQNKKLAIVDDSIVRGTTSKHLIQLLRKAGASEIYFVSASPPVKFPCVYGIDMSIKEELLASRLSVEEIKHFLGADVVVYQDLPDLLELFDDIPLCHACFSGDYPTGISEETLETLKKERECSKLK